MKSEQKTFRKKAIIIDMDGTMVDNARIDQGLDASSLTAAEWDAFNLRSKDSAPNQWCLEIAKHFYSANYELIFLTARHGSDLIYNMTNDWLTTNLPYKTRFKLVMREETDFRPDYEFKADVYNRKIKPVYDVLFAVDDKKKICDMWRSLNVPALHCEDY